MRYFEAPEVYESRPGAGAALFVAGGIRGCEDWQARYCQMFEDTNLVLLNPRRRFDPQLGSWTDADRVKQVTWEFEHLRKADAISFWFSPETLNPISLFELGSWSSSTRPIFVGCHPEYKKRKTVEVQLKLVRPLVEVGDSLEKLAAQVRTALLGKP